MTSISNQKPSVTLIGGVEISIVGRPLGQLQFGAENAGTISIGCNGKAWNLALDLVKDGCRLEFVSVAGDDFPGHAVKAQLEKMAVGVGHFHLVEGKDTAARHDILNLLDQPEMEFQNADVFSCMTTDMIDQAADRIGSTDCIVLETRFPEDVIRHIVKKFAGMPILLLPDGEQNAAKAKDVLGQLTGILAGRREAEVLSGLSILSEEELLAAGEWFSEKGIGQVFFDLGFGGVYFKDRLSAGIERPGPVRLATVVEGFVQQHAAADTAAAAIKYREV